MVKIEHKDFIHIANKFVDKPFEITNAWVEYQLAKGNKALFFTDSVHQPQILCWARVKKIKFIGEVLDIQGPIYNSNVTVKQLHKFFDKLKDLAYKGIFINSNIEYSTLFEIACRKAKFKRPIGQIGTSLTILVNLDNFNPDTKWKRNLKKAESENYKFEIKNLLSIEDCKVIEKLHEENAKIKNLVYVLDSDQVHRLVNNENILVCFLYKDSVPIASRIISIEESISYDIYACNSLESRNNGATQFLMQKIFDHLKEIGVKHFDFSRIPIGKKGANGVYEFKNSTRGDVVQYNGEWVYFRNMKLRHLYYIYNLLINKKDFY